MKQGKQNIHFKNTERTNLQSNGVEKLDYFVRKTVIVKAHCSPSFWTPAGIPVRLTYSLPANEFASPTTRGLSSLICRRDHWSVLSFQAIPESNPFYGEERNIQDPEWKDGPYLSSETRFFLFGTLLTPLPLVFSHCSDFTVEFPRIVLGDVMTLFESRPFVSSGSIVIELRSVTSSEVCVWINTGVVTFASFWHSNSSICIESDKRLSSL